MCCFAKVRLLQVNLQLRHLSETLLVHGRTDDTRAISRSHQQSLHCRVKPPMGQPFDMLSVFAVADVYTQGCGIIQYAVMVSYTYWLYE